MLKVVVLGSGNVAHHIIKAFHNAEEAQLIQVYARQPEKLHHLVDKNKVTDNLDELLPADVYIVSVSDDAISEISTNLPFANRLVVHTSGSTSINAINEKNRNGVFYPLQTFSKNKEVDFKSVPICVEAGSAKDYSTLELLAKHLSDNVYQIDTKQRQALHVAAVFVNNFTNHLYAIGNEICSENNVSFEILKPLLLETANKVMTLTPQEAQTGPARRNDRDTIARHLAFINNNQTRSEIYSLLTKSIQANG